MKITIIIGIWQILIGSLWYSLYLKDCLLPYLREDLGNIDQAWHCEESDSDDDYANLYQCHDDRSDDDNADLYQCLYNVSYDSDLEVPYTLSPVFVSLSFSLFTRIKTW